jgi:hypothetical protein
MAKTICGERWTVKREHYTFFGHSHDTYEPRICLLPEGHRGKCIPFEEMDGFEPNVNEMDIDELVS